MKAEMDNDVTLTELSILVAGAAGDGGDVNVYQTDEA